MDWLSQFLSPALPGQILLGLINGAFYALLSLGMAIIFGLLNVVNFMHGAQYMLGAFIAWLLLSVFGYGYWYAIVIAPLAVGLFGVVIEYTLIRRVYRMDHLYGFLLTLGLALLVQGLMQQYFGSAPQRYSIPPELNGGLNLGFMFLPYYRAWVIVASLAACVVTWLLIEKTLAGARLRAAIEDAQLVRAFGVKVPRLRTLTYGFGVALAALGGVMAAPIYQVTPTMGQDILVTVFAVVVVGGMGSIFGAAVAGFLLGFCEGLAKALYPEFSTIVIFIIMALVLLWRPAGLFGKDSDRQHSHEAPSGHVQEMSLTPFVLAAMAVAFAILPFFFYPAFVMKAMCFALFACSFALLFGHVGLLSFGHAAFFGGAAYATGFCLKILGLSTELSVLVGVATAALMGLVFGLIATRRRGIYFAMITMALAQIVYFYIQKAAWTGGDDGMTNIPRGKLLGLVSLETNFSVYIVVLSIFCLGFFAFYRIIRSPFGQVVRMIRDNEQRATSLGFNVARYKVVAFVLSASLAGLAGAAKVLVFQLASTNDLYWSTSGEVILMTLVGGSGTIVGPVVGAFAIVGLESYLAERGSWVVVAQGAVFVLCVLGLRQGIYGTLLGYLARRRNGALPAASIAARLPGRA